MSRQQPSVGKSAISQSQPRERLLTPGEVAALFRVDPKTVTRWASAGRIGSIRTQGGHRRFRETEVRALLASLTNPAPLRLKEDDSELAVSIYLEDGRDSTVRNVQSALQAVAKEIGFDLIAEFDPVYGSFWQRFRAKAQCRVA
jgi:excisionase family DNA binding protein